MKIREAKKLDIHEWSRMRTRLWTNTADKHRLEIEAYFTGVSNDIVQVFVLEIDQSNLAGFIELNIRNFAEGSILTKIPYVEAWYIDPQYQNRGIGKQLMAKAEQWAIDQGYSEIASDTEIDNHHSIAIHTKLGFKETERLVCFLKHLK